jgi:hypothetical protein
VVQLLAQEVVEWKRKLRFSKREKLLLCESKRGAGYAKALILIRRGDLEFALHFLVNAPSYGECFLVLTSSNPTSPGETCQTRDIGL